jgi:hypothetical protein
MIQSSDATAHDDLRIQFAYQRFPKLNLSFLRILVRACLDEHLFLLARLVRARARTAIALPARRKHGLSSRQSGAGFHNQTIFLCFRRARFRCARFIAKRRSRLQQETDN